MNHVAMTFGVFATVALLSSDAVASSPEPDCAPRDQIVAKLSKEFKETQQAVGLVNQQAVLEVFVSEAGTWTIIATGTDGSSCLLSAGDNWESKNFLRGVNASFSPRSASRSY